MTDENNDIMNDDKFSATFKHVKAAIALLNSEDKEPTVKNIIDITGGNRANVNHCVTFYKNKYASELKAQAESFAKDKIGQELFHQMHIFSDKNNTRLIKENEILTENYEHISILLIEEDNKYKELEIESKESYKKLDQECKESISAAKTAELKAKEELNILKMQHKILEERKAEDLIEATKQKKIDSDEIKKLTKINTEQQTEVIKLKEESFEFGAENSALTREVTRLENRIEKLENN